ncbi:MAG: helicase-associated domain-containing protein, partial [Planctomycetes bacterium]|nr:helicase-associated domain-containing protein [Planctomycetota bacterium]
MPRLERDPSPSTLETSLRNFGAQALRALARSFEPRPPTRKDDLVALLLGAIQGEGLRRAFERLGTLEKAAVADAAHDRESRFDADRFLAKHGRAPDFGSPDARIGPSPTLLSLFIPGSKAMPQDLAGRLREFVPRPEPAKVSTVEEPPPSVTRKAWKRGKVVLEAVPLARQETAPAALHDILAVLRLVEGGKLTVGEATRRPTGATVAAVRSVLASGDFYPEEAIRAYAWPLIVQAAGLAAARAGRLELTKKGREALSAPPHETLGRAWEEWLQTDLVDELSRVEAIRGQSGKGKRALTDPWERRDAIAQALALCPPGRWIEVDEFFRFLRAEGPKWRVTDDPWTLYFSEARYGSLGYQGHGDWKILEARYVLAFLFEVAATMGLIDVAYASPDGARPDYDDVWGTDDLAFLSRYDGLAYLRLNPLGSWCLGIAERFEGAPLEARKVLRVLPDLEVVAAEGALPPADRLFLERFAEKVSDRVWRLERGRILAASEGGMAPSALGEFLAARSGEPLPETVEALLRDVAGRLGRVADRGGARLFECADEFTARLLENEG